MPTIRRGAFGGVGAIRFGRRRDVAGHCDDLIPCRAKIYGDRSEVENSVRDLSAR